MMDYFEHIDEYIAGNLDDKDRRAFENAMLSDKHLKFAVDHYEKAKFLASGLVEHEADEILKSIKQDRRTPVRIKFLKPVGIAAAILLLFGVLWYMDFLNKEVVTPSELATLYFSNYGSKMRSNEEPVDLFEKAVYFFNLNSFEKSTPLFEQINDRESLKYLAFSAFIQGENNQVISIIEENRLETEQELFFLKALALLRLEEVNKTKAILEELVSSDDEEIRVRAVNLLSDLDKL